MNETQKELNSILIELLIGLEFSTTRIMLTMAIITAYHLQETMVRWVANHYEKVGTITAQAFMSKLDELTGEE